MRKYYPITQTIKSIIYLAFLVMTVSGLIGCGVVSQINLFTDQEEIQLGKNFSGQIEKEIQVYQDPVVTTYIVELGQYLAKHSKRKGITYHFKVVDTDVVNAFALPGGYLYVNLGLIRASETESELAGVIAHEIGHVVGKHGAEQLTKQLGLSAMVELVLGKDQNQIEKIVAGIVTTGTLIKYSRDDETEADEYAVQEMYDAGIHPEGIATFFEKLLKLQKNQPSQIEQIFSTHPPTDERIINVRSRIAALPPKSNLRRDSSRFQQIKRRILPPKKKQQ